MKNPIQHSHCIAFAAALFAASVLSAETNVVLRPAFDPDFRPPAEVTVAPGEMVRIRAEGVGESAQWTWNGNPIQGAVDPTLVIPVMSWGHIGSYEYTPLGIGIPERGSQKLILNVGPVSRFVNISTRSLVGTGEGTLISGFVVVGPEEKKVLIRAVGPSLGGLGVTGFLADPVLTIYDRTGAIYTEEYDYDSANDEMADIAAATALTGAFPLAAGSNDRVMLRPFGPGAYTVHVRATAAGGSGVVLLEIYEVP